MKIVIAGGGFAGVKLALRLATEPGLHVTLISDRDHFVYYPALYAVATGGAQRQSFIPLDAIFAHRRVHVVKDTIVGYDPERRLLRGARHTYSYDRVVIAFGVVTSYFGIKGLDTNSFGIKSSDQITRFRRHLHDELTSTRRLDKQYVIVGAGPTGIELASSLAHYIDHIASAHGIRHNRIRIMLVEAAPRVAPRMSEEASRIITRRLKSIGVSVMTNEKVEWQDDDEVYVSGRSIPTRTVVWTSGVTNHPFFDHHSNFFCTSTANRVVVDEHLMVGRHTYVIGDNAATPYTGLAQTALHDARYVAGDIIRTHRGQIRPVYRPYEPPVVIPVGRSWALLEWKNIRIYGFVGHMLRRAADIIGYHEVLPARLAVRAWRAVAATEDECATCQKNH